MKLALLLRIVPLILLCCYALPLTAQKAAPQLRHRIHTSVGLLLSAERDFAYSPLRYEGPAFTAMLGYEAESADKSEQYWLHFHAGELETRFGADLTSISAGLFNYTFYHRDRNQNQGFHFGWSNNNLWSQRDFQSAGNYNPRFDYQTTFGPAARYRYAFGGKLSKLSLEVSAHLQVIGFTVLSGFVTNAPDGYLEEDASSFGKIWDSLRFFYPGKNWNWGLWPSVQYTFDSGNSLQFLYRYDMNILEGAHRSSQSRGYYYLTLSTLIGGG